MKRLFPLILFFVFLGYYIFSVAKTGQPLNIPLLGVVGLALIFLMTAYTDFRLIFALVVISNLLAGFMLYIPGMQGMKMPFVEPMRAAGYYARFLFLGVLAGREILMIIFFKRSGAPYAKVLMPLFFLNLWAMLSCFWSINAGDSLLRAISMLLIIISVFLALWIYLKDIKRVYQLMGVMYHVYGVAVLLSVVIYAVIPSVGIRGDARFQGILENPNSLGGVAAILFILSCIKVEEARKLSFFNFLYLGSAMVAIFASGSRSALLLGFDTLILRMALRRLDRAMVIAVVAGMVYGIGSLAFSVTGGVEERGALRGGLSGRDEAWAFAFKVIGEDPLTGNGYRTAIPLYYKAAAEGYFKHHSGGAHSVYLSTGIGLGVPGMLFMGVVFFLLGLTSWQLIRMPGVPPLGRWLGSFMLLCEFYAFVESAFTAFGSMMGFAFWFLVMIGFKIIILVRQREVWLREQAASGYTMAGVPG